MTDEPTPAREPADEDPKIKELKARAKTIKATVRVGHDGVSVGLLKQLNAELDEHELVKVKFVALKDQKKVLVRVIEQQTDALLVQRLGHTATYFRARKLA